MLRERNLQRRDREAAETRRSGKEMNLLAELSTISLASGKIEEEGIMLKILLALPIKSLIRFKCVCKSWHSFISDPQFGRSHLNRCMLENPNSLQKFLFRVPDPADGGELLDYERSNFEAFDIEDDKLNCPVRLRLPITPSEYCYIVGTCDGLVCLRREYTHIHKVIVIWNPTTGAFREIQPPAAHFHILGFGYDPVGGDYKILVSVPSSLLKKFYNVHVFALKGESWREVCQILNLNCSSGVYLNGCLHWLPRKFQLGATHSILSFDLCNETFQRVIPLPDINTNNIYSSLVVLGERLCLYNYQLFHNRCYIMMEYGLKSSWTEFQLPAERGSVNYPLCIRTDGKVLGILTGSVSLISEKNDLYLYSMEDNSCEIASFGDIVNCRPCVYVESLVSP